MTNQPTRRDFLKFSTATAAGFWVAAGNAREVRAMQNSKIRAVCIGVGGKGRADAGSVLACDGEIIGICDVDKTRLAAAQEKVPEAKAFADYREMLTDLKDKFEVVTVSIPDHMHAPATLMAMRMGKSCYTQKPLTRTIYEARKLAEVARETGVCTQLGNQGTAIPASRMAIAQLQAGVLGTLEAVYAWSNRPSWTQKPFRPVTIQAFIDQLKKEGKEQKEIDEAVEQKKAEIATLKDNVDWNLWLGVAPERDFWPGTYHPNAWRGWWAFGGGALGDMACHQLTVPFAGCELKDPISVVAKTSGHDFDSFPEESTIRFEFPATANRPAIPFYWYDRKGNKPAKEIFEKAGWKDDVKDSGILIVGEKGCLYSGDDYCIRYELRRPDGSTLEPVKGLEPEQAVVVSMFNPDPNHFNELLRAVQANDPKLCKSNFPDRGGPLTETILLGNLAVWAASKPGEEGEKIEWDAKNLKVTNLTSLKTPGVAELVKPTYRGDYRLD